MEISKVWVRRAVLGTHRLVKVDIEGREAAPFGRDCDWLDRVDAMCVGWHVEDGAERLAGLAKRFGFAAPCRLPGNIWRLMRQNCVAEPAVARC